MTHHIPQYQENSLAQLLVGSAFAGGATALAAGIFTTISPLGGAIFGVSEWVTGHLINWICNKMDCCPDSMVAKVGKMCLQIIGGIVAAALLTTLAGFPMTFTTGVILSVATTATLMISACAFCCLCAPLAAITGLGSNTA